MDEEFLDFDNRNAWNSVYQGIRNESTNFNYTYKEARKTENKSLNRYRDVNPFDHSRVRLKRGGQDYINASLVQVPSANRSYILTQGPLPSTTGHFWLMIWEQESKAVLMLNRVIEKNTIKCHQYWPLGTINGGEDEMVLKDVGLMVTYLSSTEASNYTLRKFMLTDFQTGNSRTVLQFHYTTWPDFGVPESPAAFLNFLMDVRQSGALMDNVGPAVVHCSAGIGRSGTFCLVDSSLVLIHTKGDASSINIRELLMDMRRYRMGLIQTPDQLRFSYMAIIEGSKNILKNHIVNNIGTYKENIKNVDHIVNNNGEDNESESSDEGVSSSNCTPPPLPPRPNRVHDVSPESGNSFSESSLSATGSLDALTCANNNFDSVNSIQTTDLNNSVDLSQNSESATEIRLRKRKERSEKTASIVQSIKKKQKESEQWQKRRLGTKSKKKGVKQVSK